MVSPEQYQHAPRPSGHTLTQARDTSTIANNLASARGIPSHQSRGAPASPALSAQNARARMADSPTKSKFSEDQRPELLINTHHRSKRENGSKRSWMPPASPTQVTSQQVVPLSAGENITSGLKSLAGDEPFRRFYSTFEGLISKLSAPLAFASLPLGVEPSSPDRKSAADTKLDRDFAAADFTSYSRKEPDVTKLVSSAALRAIKDKDGQLNTNNTAESFYVVPTAGGMISYAGILSRARNGSFDEAEDDFVDANENPPSPEEINYGKGSRPRKQSGRSSMISQRGGSKLSKTAEELHMENEALKHLSDTLAKRLHMWEVNAQSSSLALQQSLRAMHNHAASRHASPSASTIHAPSMPGTAPSLMGDTDPRVKELEELTQRNEKELERVSRENEKLKAVLGRYRDRWEKLKEGARVRRENNAGGVEASKSPAPPNGPGDVEGQDDDDEKPENLQEI